MMAPTPPRANFSSQLTRVWVPDPSSLSNRPEILDLKIRFLTVKWGNLISVNITAFFIDPLQVWPRRLPRFSREGAARRHGPDSGSNDLQRSRSRRLGLICAPPRPPSTRAS